MSHTLTVEQLEDAGLDRDEARGVAVPQGDSAQATSPESRICTDYLHATHPDTGLDVVYVPGEALPDFALAIQQARNAPPAPEQPGTIGRSSLKAQKAEPKP